jgi:proteasome accessory factor C
LIPVVDLDVRFRRLLLLVPYVLRRSGASVKEVCERFGIKRSELVSDLNLLFMCGLPGYGPGDLIEAFIDGDQVWIAMADYFARPMRLTPAEGLLLYAGAKAMSAVGTEPALERAMKRLESALAPGALERVDLGVDSSKELGAVKQALESRRRIRIVYQSGSKDEVTEREVDPWAVLFSEGRWYLVGYCHRVSDERIFRVDRIRTASVLDTPYDPPADLDLTRYHSIYSENAQAVEVTLDLSPRAGWVPEYYPLISKEELPEGWTRIRLKAGGMAWLERLLLGLGIEAQVVEPESLKQRLRDLACKMAERYRSPVEA